MGRRGTRGFPDDPAWIAGCENAFGDVACDYATRTNYGARSDVNPGQYQGTTADPHIRADLDGFSELLLSSQLVIERVQRRQNLHAGTEERVVPDMYVAYIEHDAIEVEEYARTEMDVGAVVTVERR